MRCKDRRCSKLAGTLAEDMGDVEYSEAQRSIPDLSRLQSLPTWVGGQPAVVRRNGNGVLSIATTLSIVVEST
jgi:hypothetical protein